MGPHNHSYALGAHVVFLRQELMNLLSNRIDQRVSALPEVLNHIHVLHGGRLHGVS